MDEEKPHSGSPRRTRAPSIVIPPTYDGTDAPHNNLDLFPRHPIVRDLFPGDLCVCIVFYVFFLGHF